MTVVSLDLKTLIVVVYSNLKHVFFSFKEVFWVFCKMSQITNKSPISVLDEFCKKKMQPPAEYKLTSDGIASDFVCTITSFNETITAKGIPNLFCLNHQLIRNNVQLNQRKRRNKLQPKILLSTYVAWNRSSLIWRFSVKQRFRQMIQKRAQKVQLPAQQHLEISGRVLPNLRRKLITLASYWSIAQNTNYHLPHLILLSALPKASYVNLI